MLNPEIQKKLIAEGRNFMKSFSTSPYDNFVSDQQLKLPQPPLVKAPMAEQALPLPRNFEDLDLQQDFIALLTERRSSRVYTQQPISLLQLSFMLWATQGIKDIRGKSYATLRTVPSGGARHGFETYLLGQHVKGLQPGAYHYLPLGHQLEFLHAVEDLPAAISLSLEGQSWASKASVVFYWSFLPYRCEWRYGIWAHRVAVIDAGHVSQNLYLACVALGLGTCAIAAFDMAVCDALFGLDGEEEFTVYASPVGTISPADQKSEKAFYQFVEDEGL
jgi:SagB-type dehydrogenase family enzyme